MDLERTDGSFELLKKKRILVWVIETEKSIVSVKVADKPSCFCDSVNTVAVCFVLENAFVVSDFVSNFRLRGITLNSLIFSSLFARLKLQRLRGRYFCAKGCSCMQIKIC